MTHPAAGRRERRTADRHSRRPMSCLSHVAAAQSVEPLESSGWPRWRPFRLRRMLRRAKKARSFDLVQVSPTFRLAFKDVRRILLLRDEAFGQCLPQKGQVSATVKGTKECLPAY